MVHARRRPEEPGALPGDVRPHRGRHADEGRARARRRRMRAGPRRGRHRLRGGAVRSRAPHDPRAHARRSRGGRPRGVPARVSCQRSRRSPHRRPDARHGDAHRLALPRDRGARRPVARRRRRGLRHRRRGGRLPAHPAPRRLPPHRARELPHHDPRRRELRAAVDLGGAPVVRRRAAGSRRPDRGRHHGPRRRHGRARAARRVRPRPPRAAGDVPHVQRPHRRGRVGRRAPVRAPAPPALPRHRQHGQPAHEPRVAHERARRGHGGVRPLARGRPLAADQRDEERLRATSRTGSASSRA